MPRQDRLEYAAGFSHGLLVGGCRPTSESPKKVGVRCGPAHIHQVRAGGEITRFGYWFTLVPPSVTKGLRNACCSLTGLLSPAGSGMRPSR